MSTNKVNIAIVGAGIAGLNCGHHLKKSGRDDFIIYEAQGRNGGRILTHNDDALGLGTAPELGGDFIDSNHADMLGLIEEFGLKRIDLRADERMHGLKENAYFFDGKHFSLEEVLKEYSKVSGKIALDQASLGENYDTPAAKAFDLMSLHDYVESLDCADWFKRLLRNAYSGEFGRDTTEQSSINMLNMIDTKTKNDFKIFGVSDERYRVRGGNKELIAKIEDSIGSSNIKHHHILKSISDNPTGGYILDFGEKGKVEAQIVVMTIPFTMLRAMPVNLKEMSDMKKKCIHELGYGINTKVVMKFHSRAWRVKPNDYGGYLYHSEIANGWDESYNNTFPEKNAGYTAFFGGEYSQKMYDRAVKNPHAPSFHTWKTNLSDEDLQTTLDQLDAVFPGTKAAYAGRQVYADWISFPYSKGSYSCYLTGQWTTISGHEREPIGKVLFAGEHCSLEFQGYMNGGAETGRRAAEDILAMK